VGAVGWGWCKRDHEEAVVVEAHIVGRGAGRSTTWASGRSKGIKGQSEGRHPGGTLEGGPPSVPMQG